VHNPLDYLYEAVGWVFTHIYDVLSPVFGAASGWTWALSIVILVALMRLVMVPLFIKQMHTTRAMSSLQPQMAALRKKYKNDKQTLNQETMKLYQEAGVNPLMGCLPFALQLPLFFGLFSVLRAIADYKPHTAPIDGLPVSMVTAGLHAKILGVSIADKVLFTHSQYVPLHAKLVIVGFVLISMATTYLTIRQSMKRGMMPAATPDNPMASSQKYMAYIMPFFALTGLYWPFGLVLYWVTTNVWTLGQQWLLGKRYPYTPPAPVDGPAPASVSPAAARSLTGGSGRSRATGTRSQQPAGRLSRAAVNGTGSKTANAAGAKNGAVAKGSANVKRGPAGATSSGRNAAQDGASSGMLKRLGRGRAEPEPEPEPEVKLVRHQTQRQSRSKRTGKR
jgi:YidC/Oxa1 family membrane protein insertase